MKKLPSIDAPWTPVRMIGAPRRPHLVILRTGKKSIHNEWVKDLSNEERNWDLMLSHYADSEPICSDAEMIVRQGAFKFSAIHRLFKDIGWLKQYSAVWLCDDDIMTSWSNINRMFDLFNQYELLLAQPALTADSYFSLHVTLQQPDHLMHFTNYAEVMAPLFSARALQLCLPSFKDAVTGWGIDWAWTALLGRPRNKIAVIDATPVFHTRPVLQGDMYKDATTQQGIDCFDELEINLEKYGVAVEQLVYGGLKLQPHNMGEIKLAPVADARRFDKIAALLGVPANTAYRDAPDYRAALPDWRSGQDSAAVPCPILPLRAQDEVMRFGLTLHLKPLAGDQIEILQIGAQRKEARIVFDAGKSEQDRFHLRLHICNEGDRRYNMLILPEMEPNRSYAVAVTLVPCLGYVSVSFDNHVVAQGLLRQWQWGAVDRAWIGSKRLQGALLDGWISPASDKEKDKA